MSHPEPRKTRPPGRPKGSPNKVTALLKDAILLAAEKAGGKEGLVGFLENLALENPTSFAQLLGKVLPLQVTGENGAAIETITRIVVETVPAGGDAHRED